MTSRAKTLILSLAAVSLLRCGSKAPTTPTTGDELAMTPSADPVVATASPDKAYQYSATVTVTLAESNGLGVLVDGVSGRLDQATAGIVVVTATTPVYRFQARGTGNKVPARSSLPVTLDFLYTLGDGSREALLTITFQLYDDAGVAYTQTKQIKVI